MFTDRLSLHPLCGQEKGLEMLGLLTFSSLAYSEVLPSSSHLARARF